MNDTKPLCMAVSQDEWKAENPAPIARRVQDAMRLSMEREAYIVAVISMMDRFFDAKSFAQQIEIFGEYVEWTTHIPA